MVLSCCLAGECLVPRQEVQFVVKEPLLSEVYRFIAVQGTDVHTIALITIEGEGTQHFLRAGQQLTGLDQKREHLSDTRAPSFTHFILGFPPSIFLTSLKSVYMATIFLIFTFKNWYYKVF
ncbi:hypothetical protein KIL84_019994 [Mauremys mutica]|uniref:Uncharacterized protein n=1 Tax=Mauremys mutica TaxID=74926 RepID=A0A9D4BB48_9SAUR|nr:hypothetical protein KIL84_019994 [Mauremys mutica]